MNDYRDILRSDLPGLEERIENDLLETTRKRGSLGFEHLLHAEVRKSSYEQFRNHQFRDAVLNAVVALFDLIRKLSGLREDGEALINRAFSLTDAYLVFSDLDTDSGQNDQKGFMQILRGAYQGIRNPKAHTLEHDLTEEKAAQYLVFTSLLARRVEDRKRPKAAPSKKTASPRIPPAIRRIT